MFLREHNFCIISISIGAYDLDTLASSNNNGKHWEHGNIDWNGVMDNSESNNVGYDLDTRYKLDGWFKGILC